MKQNCILLLIIALLIVSCKHKESDAVFFAKNYCECLDKANASKDFFDARVKCDAELLSINRLFRVIYIENYYGRYMFQLSPGLRDSAAKFNQEFIKYLEKNCCEMALEGCNKSDSMQIKRKLIDSLYR